LNQAFAAVAPGKFAAIAGIVAAHPLAIAAYRQLLREHDELVHVSVQVEQCRDHECGCMTA